MTEPAYLPDLSAIYPGCFRLVINGLISDGHAVALYSVERWPSEEEHLQAQASCTIDLDGHECCALACMRALRLMITLSQQFNAECSPSKLPPALSLDNETIEAVTVWVHDRLDLTFEQLLKEFADNAPKGVACTLSALPRPDLPSPSVN